jgi:DNA-binding FrmR family transcriptional regulator
MTYNILYSGIVYKHMNHLVKEKSKLLNRIKRMRGQLHAIERSLDADEECAAVLQQATACRGALDGFIAEVIEDHIREHMVDPKARPADTRAQAAEELIDIVHMYLK